MIKKILIVLMLLSFNVEATEFLYESGSRLVAVRGNAYISQVKSTDGTFQLQIRGGSLASGQPAVGVYTPTRCYNNQMKKVTIAVGFRDINMYELCNNHKIVWVVRSLKDDLNFQKELLIGDTVEVQGVSFSTIGASNYILKYRL